MRIAFAGTPGFALTQLEALFHTSHEIIVVYTQPDKPTGRGQHLQASPVKTFALAHQLPLEQPLTLRTEEALTYFASYQPDILIVAAYGLLLPDAFLQIPRYGCINVHASLLPRWRGASPIQQAILAGDSETGITLMEMTAGLDEGDMLVRAACPITTKDTTESLHLKLADLGARLLKENIDKIPSLPRIPQEKNQVTYAPKIKKETAHIQWEQDADQIERKIRAYFPWPIAYGFLETRIRFWKGHVAPLPKTSAPGTIMASTPEGILVATGQGGLLLTHAQLPGKQCLPVSEILKGHEVLFTPGRIFT